MDSLNDVIDGAIVAKRLYAQYRAHDLEWCFWCSAGHASGTCDADLGHPGQADIRDIFRKWDAEKAAATPDWRALAQELYEALESVYGACRCPDRPCHACGANACVNTGCESLCIEETSCPLNGQIAKAKRLLGAGKDGGR